MLGLILLFPLQTFATEGKKQDGEVTFARMYCDQDRLIEGDSCLISFVVYASSPFHLVGRPSKIKVKNGKLNAIPLRGQRLQRVRENSGVYYALIVEEYIAYSKDIGNLIVPSRHYEVVLSVQQEYVDSFDAFFAPPPNPKKVKLKGKSERFTLPVVKKPLRTTRQMFKSGLDVI